MYNIIYPKLSEIGISEMWEAEKMLDKGGNTVTDEANTYGRPAKFNIVKPKKLLFVDEVGDNTSQANDGNKTRKKYITGKGCRAHQQNSFINCHCITLVFTATSGDPVTCAIVVAADKLKPHEKLGFN
jgi:hypothetical protein